MSNRLFEEVCFNGTKESHLEWKVRNLERKILRLDSQLENERLCLKSVPNKEFEAEVNPSSWHIWEGSYEGDGDGPTPKGEPTMIWTWNSTSSDFHRQSSQRSIFTLINRCHHSRSAITVDQFKRQLNLLLAANASLSTELDITGKGNAHESVSPEEFLPLLKRNDATNKCNDELLNTNFGGVDNFVEKHTQEEEASISDDLIFDLFNEPDSRYGKEEIDIESELVALKEYLTSLELEDIS